MPSPSLLQRLKERKLVQWAVAYLAGAFVVFQAVEVMAEPWGISPGVQRGGHIVLLSGLFITLVLAWYHGEKGRQRVSGPELLMVAALLVVAGVALTLLRPREEGYSPFALESDDRPGIAVFPCENWSPDPDDAYFASGIHDEILLRLSKIGALRSIGRESMEWYRDNPRPMRQVAQELGVGYLGECSVLKDAERNQVRLTFQLIDGNTGTQIWAENYDEDLNARSIFDIHSDVARQVAREVGAVLTPEEQERIEARPTESIEAYNAHVMGKYWFNRRGTGGLPRAIQFFKEAVEADSTFALAYTGLADSYTLFSFYEPTYREELPVAEAHRKALDAAQRALALDDGLGEAHASMAAIRMWFEWNWEEAEWGFSRAIGLSPNYPTAHFYLGHLLHYTGRLEEGVEQYRVAHEYDPLSPHVMGVWISRLAEAGLHEEALVEAQRGLEMYPDDTALMAYVSRMYLIQERYEEAIMASPTSTAAISAMISLGRTQEATALADVHKGASLSRQIVARTALGDFDEAFHLLEEAFEERAPWLVNSIWQEANRPLRSDPRFHNLIRRLGFPE